MKKGYGPSRSQSMAAALRKRVRSAPDDYDDVLLPHNSAVPASLSFFAPPQLKYFDTYLGSTEPSESGSLANGVVSAYANYAVSVPERGDTPSTRDGNVIRITSWQLKVAFQAPAIDNATRAPVPRLVFLALVLDKQTNNAQSTAFEMFLNPSGNAEHNTQLLRNPFHGSRFEVLRSETFAFDAPTLDVFDPALPDQIAIPGYSRFLEFYIPLDVLVHFNASTRAITDVVDNSLHVVAFCSPSGGVVGENWQRIYMTYTSRIRFAGGPGPM